MQACRESIADKVRKIYSVNPFMKLCGIEIEELSCGRAVLALTIDGQKHFNLNKSAHGGVIASLADTSLGVVGATVGKRVVTASLQAAYLRGAGEGSRIRACARVVSHDGKFMVVCVEIKNVEKPVAEVLATMAIIDDFPEIPPEW